MRCLRGRAKATIITLPYERGSLSGLLCSLGSDKGGRDSAWSELGRAS